MVGRLGIEPISVRSFYLIEAKLKPFKVMAWFMPLP